jgi:hypothetical protein
VLHVTRRVTVAIAAVVLLATGTIIGLAATARANPDIPLGSCSGSDAQAKCTITGTMAYPAGILGSATAPGGEQPVEISVTIECPGQSAQQGSWANWTPWGPTWLWTWPSGSLPAASCTFTATAQNQDGSGAFTATLEYDSTPPASASSSPSSAAASASPSVSPSPSAAAVHLVRGFDGTCVRDLGDSAAPRTKVVVWACDPTAQGQGWTYRGDELRIHGSMCLNAKGKGASGSPVILWPCTGGPNEIWVHRSGGEYALKAGGYKTCLTDPGFSATNGTQIVVGACTDARDQQWSLP